VGDDLRGPPLIILVVEIDVSSMLFANLDVNHSEYPSSLEPTLLIEGNLGEAQPEESSELELAVRSVAVQEPAGAKVLYCVVYYAARYGIPVSEGCQGGAC
jgi:hypothetical protein